MRLHFIGIKGVSMEFLASLCAESGIQVTGSDIRLSGHDARNVSGADAVIYSLAISPDNPEYAEAVRQGIPLYSRAQLLGKLSAGYHSTVAVSGTHGKTTATAMLMYMLKPLNPTVHVGGYVKGVSGMIGGKELFVTEACEYKESFLSLDPDAAIILNVELDHADYFKTYANFYEAFDKFASLSKVAFVCGDNEAHSLKGREKTFSFGLNKGNDYYAEIEEEKMGYYTFCAYGPKGKLQRISLNVRGKHNVTSAMAAVAYCHYIGADLTGIENFTGVDRRFETLARYGGIEYISDYAHHPHEIDCTLNAARSIFKRILVVFEPHTYSRTQAFEAQFISSLKRADDCILLPIYAAREEPIEGVSSRKLAQEGRFKYACDYDEAADMLNAIEKNFDTVIFMGAGSIDDFARKYVSRGKMKFFPLRN